MASYNTEEILNGVRLFFDKGQVVELRIPKTPESGVIAGFFDNRKALANNIEMFSGEGEGVYYTLNPIDPNCAPVQKLGLNAVQTHVGNGFTTANCHILSRKWFYVDVDVPTEVKGKSSATNEEKAAAAAIAKQIRSDFMEQGWPEPALCDSGNGCALYWKMDAPNDDATLVTIKRCISVLATKYNQEGVADIDRKVCNAARITKAYGSLAAKGENTEERPHRIAKILSRPTEFELVTPEQFKALADLAPAPAERPSDGGVDEEMMEDCLDAFGVNYERRDEGVWSILSECPFAEFHTSSRRIGRDTEVCIKDGIPGFNCLHSGCQESVDETGGVRPKRTWKDFRNAYDPGHTLYHFPIGEEEGNEININKWIKDVDDMDEGLEVELDEVALTPEEPELVINPAVDVCMDWPKCGNLCGKTHPATTDWKPKSAEELAASQVMYEESANVVVEDEEPAPELKQKELKYPELKFPYEALPEGRLKDLTDEACAGELDPGLVVPALMGLASAVPAKNIHDYDLRINLFVCLLGMVGGGKDVSIGRAIRVLGLENHEGHLYTEHNPSGERAVAMLLMDRKDKPGPKHHCIVSYEIEETMKKAASDTSAVLQTLQHFYDHDSKTIMLDSKKGTTQKVDCRLSWLSGFPVGDKEIEPTKFKESFGENSSHGMVSRLLFGFSEKRFDNRKARLARRKVPMEEIVTKEVCDYAPEPQDVSDWDTNSITAKMRSQVVLGFEPDAEKLFIDWNPGEDYSGRDTFHVRKVAVIVALLNDHQYVNMGDWLFAKAFMEWQGNLRRTFQSSKSQRVTQGAFNEIILDETSKRTKRLKEGKLPTKQGRITKVEVEDGVKTFHWINWNQMANSMRWVKYGLSVEKAIDQMVHDGALQYMSEMEVKNDKEIMVVNKKYVRIVGEW